MRIATPKANAMLVCDNVITEQGTKKKSLIGIFESIGARNFPFIHPFLSVYVKLTEGNGTYHFRLEMVNLKTNQVTGEGKIPEEIVIDNPLKSHELVFNLRGLRFNDPGEYEFRMYSNDQIFAQKTFYVQEIKSNRPQI
jgi:hypothetical protein